MHTDAFAEISLVLAIGALIALITKSLRQPLIIAYIITGLIVGSASVGLLKSFDTVDLLGNFGITLLLFIVGLGLNPKIIKEVGKPALLTGIGQVFFTIVIGYFLSGALGYSKTSSLFIAVGLSFSSTIIILKLLSDKKELNKLHGKISIGFLLVQDILATIALLIVSAAGQNGLTFNAFGGLAIKGIGLIVLTILFANTIIKALTSFLSRSQELLFLFTLAWGFGIATLFMKVGFSLEVGALIAGISLAQMPYAQEVSSRLRPLRDFFIIVFFITLGSRIDATAAVASIKHALILSGVVIFINPFNVMMILGLLGYTKKTSFNSGLAVAQISEFSLILLLLGEKNKLVDSSIIPLMMMVAIITIAVSSYLFIYSDGIYRFLEKYLTLFERKKVKTDQARLSRYDAVLFGYKRGGSEFVKVFEKLSKKYIVIDYDPDAIDEMERQNIPYLYGDATDISMLEEIDFERIKLIASVITDHATNVFLLEQLEKQNPYAVMICHADTVKEAIELYGLGASLVVLPHYIGNEKISGFIRKNGFKKSEFNNYREKHLEYLKNHFELT